MILMRDGAVPPKVWSVVKQHQHHNTGRVWEMQIWGPVPNLLIPRPWGRGPSNLSFNKSRR